jgi:predicted dehydrogenase
MSGVPTRLPVRVGFVGVGSLATKQHLPNCVHNPRFKVMALCDLDPARARHYADRYGISQTTQKYEELLARKDIDAIVIAVHPDQHARMATAALNAGKHVYVEKPLTERIEEALQIDELARRLNLRLAVGFNRRLAPAMVDLRKLIASDTGPLIMSYRMVDDDRDRPASYRGRPRIVDEVCHVFDLFNWLARSEPVSIYATQFGRPGDHQIVVGYANGVAGSIMTSSFGSFGWPKERIEVVGDRKVIAVEDFVELQAAGIPGLTSRNYAGREYDGFSMGYAQAYAELGLPFYRYLRRQMESLLLESDLFTTQPDREKWEAVGERYPENLRIPVNYSCDKGWYCAMDLFGQAIQEGTAAPNASAIDGAKTAAMAAGALKSIEIGSSVQLDPSAWSANRQPTAVR